MRCNDDGTCESEVNCVLDWEHAGWGVRVVGRVDVGGSRSCKEKMQGRE
jgi:hypothetical protein